MSLYKLLIRRALFRLNPESAHDIVPALLKVFPIWRQADNPALRSRVAGLDFPNPVGLAAGFDKDCRAFKDAYRFDFGSVEVGTITPEYQAGNPKPRIVRLARDEAIINRMGFPSDGLEKNLARLRSFKARPGPLGINIGANKSSEDKVQDYVRGLRAVAGIADYVTINVSSPNTPGLRAFESGDELNALLQALDAVVDDTKPPVFLKVSPDLTQLEVQSICAKLQSSKISGVIVGNTTTSRPELIDGDKANESGGLSGRPLAPLSLMALRMFYAELRGAMPIISVGGISSAADVYERIRSGANLVQIYTSFIYEGPTLVREINRDLAALLARDGYTNITQAVGQATAAYVTATKRVPTPWPSTQSGIPQSAIA